MVNALEYFRELLPGKNLHRAGMVYALLFLWCPVEWLEALRVGWVAKEYGDVVALVALLCVWPCGREVVLCLREVLAKAREAKTIKKVLETLREDEKEVMRAMAEGVRGGVPAGQKSFCRLVDGGVLRVVQETEEFCEGFRLVEVEVSPVARKILDSDYGRRLLL